MHIQSADQASAIESFRSRANQALTILVKESQETATGVFTALSSKVDEAKVLAALSSLGVQVQELPRIGRLVRQGVLKL